MTLPFEPLNIHHQAQYKALLSRAGEPTSDYTFANIFGWAEHYGLQIAFDQDAAWIRQTTPEPAYWGPVGDWKAIDWASKPLLASGAHFIRTPGELADIWRETFQSGVELCESRDHFDYVYSVKELVELKGNKFHKKKNLLNQFKKKCDWEYHPLDMDCVEDVLQLQQEWYEWREQETGEVLTAENEAIRRVLTEFDRMALMGGSIKVDGKMVAYTVGERLDDETVVIHFEKGCSKCKGVYQAINQMFLEDAAQEFTWVNREQDIGDPGLRKAKMSYNPAYLLDKYEVRFK
ncbi:MAG: uncharacterized protein PWQ57_2547 [Desulfovibrionales bacterium]|nr:uncharacterized protein [Desulfovibrionales bacterium]